MTRLDLAHAIYGLRFITLLSALQSPAHFTRQNLLGLLAAFFPRPDTAGWAASWQRYTAAFHLARAAEPERVTFRNRIVKSVLRADRYFSTRLAIGAEANREKDRTQAVLGKDFLMFSCVVSIFVGSTFCHKTRRVSFVYYLRYGVFCSVFRQYLYYYNQCYESETI